VEANVSQHKARSAERLRKHDPEALDQVVAGEKRLRDVKSKKPKKSEKRSDKTLTFEEQVRRRWTRWFDQWEPDERGEVIRLVLEWTSDKEGGAE
jgi:hypothetical protein